MDSDPGGCVVASARVTGVCPDGRIDVVCDASTQCRSCRGSCHMLPTGDRGAVRIPGARDWSTGDIVRVELPAARLLRAAVVVYGLPLAGLALGGLLGYAVEPSDPGCLVGAASGLAGAFWLVARVNARLERFVLAGLEVRAP